MECGLEHATVEVEAGEELFAVLGECEGGCEFGSLAQFAVAAPEDAVVAAARGYGVVEAAQLVADVDGLDVELLHVLHAVEAFEVALCVGGGLVGWWREEVGAQLAVGGGDVAQGRLGGGDDGVGAVGDGLDGGEGLDVDLLGFDELFEVGDEGDAFGAGGEGGEEVECAEGFAVGVGEVAVFLAVEAEDVVGVLADGGAEVDGLHVALLDGDDVAQAEDVVLVFVEVGEGDGDGGVFEDARIGAVDVGVVVFAACLELVFEVVDLAGEGVFGQEVVEDVELEGVEFVELCQLACGGVGGGEVVLVVDHEVGVVEVFEFFEFEAVGDALAVAGGEDGAVVAVDELLEGGGLGVAFFLLETVLLGDALACGFFLGFEALLLEARVVDGAATHEVGEGAEEGFVAVEVVDHDVGVDDQERVAADVVAIERGESVLCVVAQLHAERGEGAEVLWLGVEVGDGRSAVAHVGGVEAVVGQQVGHREHDGRLGVGC